MGVKFEVRAFTIAEPVPGEFVLMRQLASGISRGNVFANNNVARARLWTGIRDRCLSLQCRVRAVLVVQVDDQIPIVSNYEKSAIPGTLGADGLPGSINH